MWPFKKEKNDAVTTELPITITMNDEIREMSVHLRFNESQWPSIRELADGKNIRLKILSLDWEK